MDIKRTLLNWFEGNKRDLPWRKNKNPYSVWLSEIILQQTQVVQGLPYYENFMMNYPTVCHLAKAPLDDVLKLWQGLGYYSRARNLYQTANYICEELKGEFPDSYKELIKLKGVGPYTAAAIASIAFDENVPCVDGNVLRVISRLFDIDTPVDTKEGYQEILMNMEQLIGKKQAGDFNQSVMELGALVCTPKKPKCDVCPLPNTCFSFVKNNQEMKPVKTKKVKVKKMYIYYFIMYDGEKIVLNKRGEDGIWKNLYEFPQITSEKSIKEELLLKKANERWGISKSSLSFVKTIKHKLTHRDLHISFYVSKSSQLKGNNTYIYKELEKIAVPKPVADVLKAKEILDLLFFKEEIHDCK